MGSFYLKGIVIKGKFLKFKMVENVIVINIWTFPLTVCKKKRNDVFSNAICANSTKYL